ncbi:UDP-3-O-(3-hydroxymyristoyl)glucosamine N-acyltransferase [Actinophytocola oryzae]|uniref:UDP-3-O-acylglucosamine N-acyltransferase n=1 Tax=Actinophytocola oryzae TaxID=502181 RepID=A0A4R7W4S7_9PSEU|nr:UDP-3-O-(3-hydroxymyristoyl)glucosamine N-acyltransferase [Actinophytocola oryzae]TDV57723.1 UDP-3-O-[3-hydroxymyristoyl] glucosamine N-acyltransferase [Actinophytocola oryzae]
MWTLAELAPLLGASVGRSPDFAVARPVPYDSDDPHGLAYCASARYAREAARHAVGALVLPPDLEPDRPCLYAENPGAAFARFLALYRRPLPLASGVHPTAVVDPAAEVAPGASVGPYAVVERGARIGAGARVFPFCYVGEDCVVGEETVLYPHVVLYQDVRVGARCVVHAHAVLGADGFGFAWDGTRQVRIEQVGGVRIGDDVEIGAGSAVDRATSGTTGIGAGTKLDNLVQIGHNADVGPDTLICGQAGVAGSAVVGRRVTMAGQSGVADHVTVGDGVTLAGRAVASRDIDEPVVHHGFPARPDGLRIAAALAELPGLRDRVRQLERLLAE